jgi:predicted TIM-barrel fold metal-dependent hydrolase
MRIDSHMHLYATEAEGRAVVADYPIVEYGSKADVTLSSRAGTVEDGLAALDAAGASHAFVLNSFEIPGAPWPPERTRNWPVQPPFAEYRQALEDYNAWVCDVGAQHPQLLPFVTIHPGVMTAADSAQHVADLADHRGARGLKLHTIALRLHADDPALQPTFAVCAERAMPVVVHAGPDRHGVGWSEPAAFAAALDAHPTLPLVLAHLGGASWRDLLAVADAYPQLWFDLAEIVAWTGGTNAPTAEELSALIKAVGPERVMLGSDFPWYDPADTAREVQALPGLSDEEVDGILGGNAARLIGLSS